MTEFDAFYYDEKFFINGTKEYTLGSILEKYLQKSFKGVKDKLGFCKEYLRLLHYPETHSQMTSCEMIFTEAISFFDRAEEYIHSLPPYNTFPLRDSGLYDIFNRHTVLFKIDDNEIEHEWFDYDKYDSYDDYNEDDDAGTVYHEPMYEHDRMLTSFRPGDPLDEIDDPDTIDEVLKLNAELKDFIYHYITIFEDLLRVKRAYEPFLEKIHSREEFLTNEEIADVLDEFNSEANKKLNNYDKLIPSGTMTLTYKVLKRKKTSVLCENYHFTTIGGFLYIELFKGLQNRYLPRKCDLCGRYFVLERGFYSNYCKRPVKGQPDKTCRDLGHRKRFNDKLKTDPIWSVYHKAYKAHYARYLKKKMTQAEFQKWADYAIEMRTKALDGNVEYDEYVRDMKK